MPRPCAVEAQFPAEAQAPTAKSIKREAPRRKAVASQSVLWPLFLAASVKLHGARPWHLRECCGLFIAASVNSMAQGRGIEKRVLVPISSNLWAGNGKDR